MSRSQFGKTARGEGGAVVVIVAVMLVALLGLGAIVIDAGLLYNHRRQMQTAADAAALAGVLELPGNAAQARAVADQYALVNAPEADSREFTVGATNVPNDTITAELRDSAMGLFLARFLGWNDAPVSASAVAVIGSPTAYGSGVMPFGIIASGTVEPPFGYEIGQLIPLVVDQKDASQGNWHFVDLEAWSDGKQTKTVISGGGTTELLRIGDTIYTQTGSPTGPNFDALNEFFTCAPHGPADIVYDTTRGLWRPEHLDGSFCPRLITCPVIVIDMEKTPKANDPYDWDQIDGKTAMKIVGFLHILVENDPDKKDGALWGTFLQVAPYDVSGHGAYSPYLGVTTWLSR